MFKLVVLSALLAVAAARPGFLHGAVAYSAPAVAVAAVPAAVSHQSRTDVISHPAAVIAHAAPILEETLVAAPVVHETLVAAPHAVAYAAPAPHAVAYAAPAPHAVAYAAPALEVAHVAAVPAAVSHTSRVDVHQTHPAPLVAVHAAPVVTAVHGW